MTITKRDPDSEFWQIVARGAREAEGYPDWKRGAMLGPVTSTEGRKQMNIDRIRIKRMRENAVPPSRKTDGAAGWDLAACQDADKCEVSRGKILVPLGWAFEIPEGYVGLLKPRSSWSHRLLDGVIDSDYRGEIFIPIPNKPSLSGGPERGERIAQLVIVPVLQVGKLVEVDELSDTTRGTGGHGSTGRF